jgi:hypothetical protein
MKFKIAILVGVLALCASSAFAGRLQWVAVDAGAAFPTSDLSDNAGTGWLAGGQWGMALGEKLAIGLDVNYIGLGKKTVEGFDVQPSVTQYDVAGYWMFPMKDKTQYPYIKLGLGGYSVNPDAPSGSDVGSKTLFGGNIGLGYNKALNAKSSLGLDVAYHWISQTDEYQNADGSKASLSMVTAAVHYGWAFGGEGGAKK